MARLWASVVLAGVLLRAQQLPPVPAETLAGNKLDLPSALAGHVTALCIGFTRSSQSEVKGWTAALRQQFGKDATVAVYSVAVLEDAPKLLRGVIVRAMKGSVLPADFDRFLVIYRNEKELQQAVGFEAHDDAYVVVLDRTGAIRFKQHGEASAASVNQVSSRIAAISTTPKQ